MKKERRQAKMRVKTIICAALTGNWGTKEHNPAIPMTPADIAASAYECYKAGAAVVHLHMRDAQMRPTMDAELYRETIGLIRERCDLIINITSSGDHTGDRIGSDEIRIAPFLALKPELGSFDCGTMNWMHESIFTNHPAFLEKLGRAMQRSGTKPELEIFDAGMLYSSFHYLKIGAIRAPLHYQFVLGAASGMDATVENLVFLSNKLPAGSTWSAVGLGKGQMPLMLAALALGGHVRVGLEDSLHFEKGVLAKSNEQFVERAHRIIADIGNRVATPDDAREILGLEKRQASVR
jgi:uncharacterized protein (DUF849 family)